MSDIKCPYCGRKNVIKKGKRKSSYGKKQLYFCKVCKKKFVDRPLKHRKYRPQVIYYSLIYYNLGNTLKETSKLVNKRFKVKTSTSTIHSWIKEFDRLCPISQDLIDKYEEPIMENVFEHRSLEYKFMAHRAKLHSLHENFQKLAEYVRTFKDSCPDSFFETAERCSQPLFEVDADFNRSKNLASEMASFAVKAARTNYNRHDLVEKFMLVNDKATIACEVPVWYWEKSVDRGITGHIDILQVRNGRVYILDYKPQAAKEKKAPRQLYQYASALNFRAGIPFDKITCAWFDKNAYFEYEPKDAEASLVREGEKS